VFAAWLQNLDPLIFSINGVGPRWYGFSYVAAALCAFWLYRRLALRGYTDIPAEKVADLITWVGLFGVLLGGRIGWIIFYGRFQQHPEGDHWWWARVWEGGMASHGGILGVVLSTFVLSRVWKVSWTGIGDSLCVVATVGIFLVRCANFVNGELYGHETTMPWGVQFAAELRETPELVLRINDPITDRQGENDDLRVIADRVIVEARSNPALAAKLKEILPIRHPSQLYEGLLEGLLLFAILWTVRTRFRVPRGMLTGLFFLLYPTARIIGEVYRIPDPAWKKGSLSAGQYLSLYMYIVGVVFVAWSLWRKEYERADRQPGQPGQPGPQA